MPRKWVTMTVSAADIPRLREHFERELEERGGDDPFFAQQVAARFAAAEEGDGVFPYELVVAATKRRVAFVDQEVSPWQKMLEPVRPQIGVLGFDPAGRGKDKSIAAYRKGVNVLALYDVGDKTEMGTLGRLLLLVANLRVQKIVIDVGGLGSPMEARLREVLERPDRMTKIDVEPFNSSWAADDAERYANRKSEVAFNLRARLREGTVGLPAHAGLVRELTSYTWTIGSAGRIKLVDPSPSPNLGDALLLSVASGRRVSVATVRARGL